MALKWIEDENEKLNKKIQPPEDYKDPDLHR